MHKYGNPTYLFHNNEMHNSEWLPTSVCTYYLYYQPTNYCTSSSSYHYNMGKGKL